MSDRGSRFLICSFVIQIILVIHDSGKSLVEDKPGEYPSKYHVKSPVYLDEEVSFDGKYEGLTIHNKVTPVISLSELLESWVT